MLIPYSGGYFSEHRIFGHGFARKHLKLVKKRKMNVTRKNRIPNGWILSFVFSNSIALLLSEPRIVFSILLYTHTHDLNSNYNY